MNRRRGGHIASTKLGQGRASPPSDKKEASSDSVRRKPPGLEWSKIYEKMGICPPVISCY